MSKKALLIIDVQNDFCPGGNLAVPDGDAVVSVINRLIADGGYDYIVASQDWHPVNHGSFASQHDGKKPFEMGELSGKPQVMWPDHCVQGTLGSAFHAALNLSRVDYIQQKGTNLAVDSYSAFCDNDQSMLTGLDTWMLAHDVTELHVCGLATDYCVKFSALDATRLMPTVKIAYIQDASRGIDATGMQQAEAEMYYTGIAILTSDAILKSGAAPVAKPPRFKF